MAVVVDLDPLGHVGQLEHVGEFAQDLALRGRLGEPPVERFLGIARGLFEQLAAGAALRPFDDDLVPGALAERILQHLDVGDIAVDEDALRWRHVLVELDEKARHHLGFGNVIGMGREEGAMTPVLAAANEEALDRHGPALAGKREHVGIAETFGMHGLAALDVGQRAQAVAIDGGQFEVLPLRRFGHLTC